MTVVEYMTNWGEIVQVLLKGTSEVELPNYYKTLTYYDTPCSFCMYLMKNFVECAQRYLIREMVWDKLVEYEVSWVDGFLNVPYHRMKRISIKLELIL